MGIIANKKVNDILPYAIKCRRYLHSCAELSDEEFVTSAFIYSELTTMGLEPIRVHTGMYVDITGYAPTKRIAFRADIDGLDIVEDTGLEFACKNGHMHACGHDGHTAQCLALTKLFTESQPKQNVRIIFQCAEEGNGGALKLIEGGCLKGVDMIFALHMSPAHDAGTLCTTVGPLFAGVVELDVIINGVSSHVAAKANGADSVEASALFITKAYEFMKTYSNSIFNVGKVTGGYARNVIADYIKLESTMRFYTDDDRDSVLGGLKDILASVDEQCKTHSEIKIHMEYPPLVNGAKAVEQFKSVNQTYHADSQYTAEDFAFYLKQCEGCMVWLGVRDEKHTHQLHSNKFDFDEEIMKYGVQALYNLNNIE